MVYTDNIHLIADTLDELHEFAKAIGLKKEWFQPHKRHPHYDIWGVMLSNAINNGAVVLSQRELCQTTIKLLDRPEAKKTSWLEGENKRWAKCTYPKYCKWKMSPDHPTRPYLNNACYLSGGLNLDCPTDV